MRQLRKTVGEEGKTKSYTFGETLVKNTNKR